MPLDPNTVQVIQSSITNAGISKGKIRLRSSSNAEDLNWFSGAGLYSSESAYLNKLEEIEMSLKKVWASLWSDRAFVARQQAGIDQRSVGMGVLIHPSYRKEKANGVALFDGESLDVIVQVDKESVTNPRYFFAPSATSKAPQLLTNL